MWIALTCFRAAVRVYEAVVRHPTRVEAGLCKSLLLLLRSSTGLRSKAAFAILPNGTRGCVACTTCTVCLRRCSVKSHVLGSLLRSQTMLPDLRCAAGMRRRERDTVLFVYAQDTRADPVAVIVCRACM